MDLRFGAGEGMSSLFQASPSSTSSAVPDGYFAALARRAGYTGSIDRMRCEEPLREPVPAREILHRELLKQRIREEIIAREMPEIKLLEEEVRRELEVERALAMRQLQESTLSSVGAVPAEARVPLADFGPEPGEERRMAGKRPAADGPFGENVFGERPVGERPLPAVPNGGLLKKLCLQKTDHWKKGPASASTPNAKPPNNNVAGMKRKASKFPGIAQMKAGELAGSKKHDWTCTVCQVRTTSREALNEHRQGKKHKAKEGLLGITKQAEGSPATTRADKPLTLAKTAAWKKAPANPQGKNAFNKGAKQQQKTGPRLWCELCKLECNSDQMLASHLGGKRHRTKLEESQKWGVATSSVPKKGASDEVQSNQVKKDSSGAAGVWAGIVEGPALEGRQAGRNGGSTELNPMMSRFG